MGYFGVQYTRKFKDKNGKEHSTSINGERFVYYQRLATDTQIYDVTTNKYLPANPETIESWRTLYRKATSLLDYRIGVTSDMANIAEYFKKLRDSEYQKEVALLKEKLGKDVIKEYNFNAMNEENIGANLIKAINELLNIKEVFQRNLSLITDTNQKQIIGNFPEYFETQYDNNQEEIYKEIELTIQKSAKSRKIDDIIDEVMSKWIPKLTKDALIHMFTESDVEAGAAKEFKDAYKELASYLKKDSASSNQFIQSFIKAYNLDHISDWLNQTLGKVTKGNWKSKVRYFTTKEYKNSKGYYSEKKWYSESGLASEYLGNFVVNFVSENIGNDGKSFHSGGTNQKADFIVTYNIPEPEGIVGKWLQESTFGTRPADIKAMHELEAKLNDINNGFIVYVNAKNIKLGDNDKRFSAGSPISMDTFDTMMHLTPGAQKVGRSLIFMALQLIPGAIGEGQDEQVKVAFSRAIALALFDDYDTVGEISEQGTNNIHLLYLNGIYLPISFYFDLLYKAFSNYAQESLENVLKVNINYPREVMYSDMQEQAEETEGHPWGLQSEKAVRETTLQYRFLNSFQEEMRKLNITFN
jgi:hypothetical protein